MAVRLRTGANGVGATPGRRRRWPWILGAIIVLLAIIVTLWDWNWFKGPIERRVSAATGREFRIEGDLDVRLGRTVGITADGLRLANSEWSDEPEMVGIGRLDVGIEVMPLLRRRVVLPWIRLERPVVVAERDAEGRANWEFEPRDEAGRDGADDSPMPLPQIGELTIVDGRVRYREPGTDVDVAVASQLDAAATTSDGAPAPEQTAGQAPPPEGAAAAASPPLDIKGKGRYRGEAFTLDARVDSPLDIQRTDRPYRLRVDAQAGETRAQASGAVLHPLQLADFSIGMALSGPDLAELTTLAGTALPKTPPYALEGRLARRGAEIAYEDFKGRIGDSDISGTVSYEPRATRPMLRANLRSDRLDLDDLAGLVGAPPATGKGETASSKQAAQAKRAAERDRVLPDEPYDLAKLRSIDADVQFRATRIDAPSLPISALATHLHLDDGRLRLDPLDAAVAGGRVQGRVALDSSRDPIGANARLRLRGLQLPRLVPGAQSLVNSAGALSGSLDLTGRGNSVAGMLGTADGKVELAMGKGRLSNLLLELAGLDLAESLAFLMGQDKLVTLRCAWTGLTVEQSVVGIDSAAFDTTDTVLYLQGRASLAEEGLDIRLVPQPKDMSPLAVRTPIDVRGTFKAPRIRPDPLPLIARGAAAAVLYAIAPPAALLALIETGPGEDTDCGSGAAGEGKQGEAKGSETKGSDGKGSDGKGSETGADGEEGKAGKQPGGRDAGAPVRHPPPQSPASGGGGRH